MSEALLELLIPTLTVFYTVTFTNLLFESETLSAETVVVSCAENPLHRDKIQETLL